ncbi:collagen-like protein [Nocardioides sp.]|uniref:collagen-like triple helix repeat-containing protein n=1 Tax=Nocardioides sp. TaxID=35761 RepID=UPI002C28E01A|nr:collagen-like protein [Nocardioides sp.]HXH78572.1 collagen-like protein [Nocardioides sp.]
MTAPRSSRLPELAVLATTAIASAALVVTAGPATLAAADRLITGQDIADRSIGAKDLGKDSVRSKTIRKNAVQGSDILDGTITAEDLAAGLRGVVGPTGATGAPGKDGAAGVAGPPGQGKPTGVATWRIHHQANGATSFSKDSTDTVPAGALVEPLAYTFTGDFSSCTGSKGGGRNGQFSLVNVSGLVSINDTTATAQPVQSLSSAPSALRFTTSCITGGGDVGTPGPIPSFDASLTFQWTVRDTTPTRSFS